MEIGKKIVKERRSKSRPSNARICPTFPNENLESNREPKAQTPPNQTED
jgi:hypothetical protein